MKLLLLIGALVASLAGCAATAPVTIEKPLEVKVPVAVTCLATMPAKPAFLPESALLTGSGYQVVNNVRADRLARIAYEGELEAALSGCVK